MRVAQLLASSTPCASEVDLLTAAGARRPALLSLTALATATSETTSDATSDSASQRMTCVVVTDLCEQRAAAAALQDSETKYRLLAENAAECIFWIGADGRFKYVSPASRRLSGYSAEEFLADPDLMLSLVHPDDLERYRAHVHYRDTDTCELEFRIVRRDGEHRWVAHYCHAMYDEAGHYLGRHGRHRDITEHKQATDELRIAAIAFESQSGTIITDAEGIILRVNPAFSRLTGYSAQEAIGQKPTLLKSGRHDSEFYRRMWASLREKGSWQGEIWNKRKNGQIYAEVLTITSVMTPEHGLTHYVGSYSDIGKEALAALQESESFKRAILNSVAAEIAVIDCTGTILAVNEPWQRFAVDNGIAPGDQGFRTRLS
jgi:PAS domain S-box-containing protein